MTLRVCFLVVCVVLALSAQTSRRPAARKPAAPATKTTEQAPASGTLAWPVGELQVKGNKLYSQEQILAVAGLKIGQMAGKAEFDAARDRLLSTGAFEEVGYRF